MIKNAGKTGIGPLEIVLTKCKERLYFLSQPIKLKEAGFKIAIAPDFSEIYHLIHSKETQKTWRANILDKLFSEYDFPLTLLPAWAWEFIHYKYRVWANIKSISGPSGREKLFFNSPLIKGFYTSFEKGDIQSALDFYREGGWSSFIKLSTSSGLSELFDKPIKKFFTYIDTGKLKNIEEVWDFDVKELEIDNHAYSEIYKRLKQTRINDYGQTKPINNKVDAHSGALAFSVDKKSSSYNSFIYLLTQSKYPLKAFNSIPISSKLGSFLIAMTPSLMESFVNIFKLNLKKAGYENRINFIKRGIELSNFLIENMKKAETEAQYLIEFKETSDLLTEEYFKKKKFLDSFSDQCSEFIKNYISNIFLSSELNKAAKIKEEELRELEKTFGIIYDERKFLDGLQYAQFEIQNRILESIEKLKKFIVLKKEYRLDGFSIREKLDEISKTLEKDDLVL